jgi:hypothetical protein
MQMQREQNCPEEMYLFKNETIQQYTYFHTSTPRHYWILHCCIFLQQ